MGLVLRECGTRVMDNEKPGGAESPLEQHVRQVLAQISALKARLRAQEQAAQSGSGEAAERNREDDGASGVHDADPPP